MSDAMHPADHHKGLRAAASFAAVKGFSVLSIGLGFAILVYKGESARDMAGWLVENLHMGKEGAIASWFLNWSKEVSLEGWFIFFGFVFVYFAIQIIEAIGLWHEKRWAEWLAALSGSIYIPLEVMKMIQAPSWMCFVFLVINVTLVGYMVWVLWTGRKQKSNLQTQKNF